MDFVVSLAHFCETHGPTTVLCTQIAPICCPTCFPVSTTLTSETISKNTSFSSSFWESSSPVVTPVNGPLFSPFASPPTSPRSPSGSFNPYFGHFTNDAHNSRRYSISSEADGDACDSCNLVVPKNKVSGEIGEGSPLKNGKRRDSSTVLRSAHTITAYGSGPESEDENDSPIEAQNWAPYGTSPASHASSKSSTGSSPIYVVPHTHMHSLTYVTRRQPDSQSIYSRLRHSCIRALSTEALPRGASSGPLSFGDDIAGYSIAYIFRLPDPRARGQRRTYALTALVRDNARAMAAFFPITKAFEAIANRILVMTDRVLERERDSSMSPRPSTASLLRTPPLSASLPATTIISKTPTSPTERARSSANSPVSSQRNISDVSSFLAAKKVDPDGYPRMSREVMRAKGLPEIVGKEDFFADLHIRFCSILYDLVMKLPR